MRSRTANQNVRLWWVLLPVVAGLLAYSLISLTSLLRFPPFIDEGIHIGYAQKVLSGRLLAGAQDSRLLVPILLALFNPTGAGQLFIGRTMTALFSLVAVALVYRLTKDMANRAAALLAMTLVIFCPMFQFYERMVLIDGYVVTGGLLVMVLVWRTKVTNWQLNGIFCGLALALTVAIKGTGIVFLAIPLIGFVTMWRGWKLRWLAVCYAVFGAIWIPLYLFLRSRGVSYFGLAETVSNVQGAGNIINRFLDNLGAFWEINAVYLSIPFLLIFLGGAFLWCLSMPRKASYLLLSLIIPAFGILALTPLARTRWLILPIPLLIIAGMIGIEDWGSMLPPRWRSFPLALIVVGWLAGVFLPYYVPLRTDPTTLPLSPTDRREYITADSSGFALKEVADYLKSQKPSSTVGMLANCVGLSLYMPGTLECPLITWDGSQQATITNRVNQLSQRGAVYVVLENLSYISAEGITAPMQLLATFERPGGTSKLRVYRVGTP